MVDMTTEVEELLKRRDRLLLDNREWARLSKQADPDKVGINYATIRRMEEGRHAPRVATVRILKLALDYEEARRGEVLAEAAA